MLLLLKITSRNNVTKCDFPHLRFSLWLCNLTSLLSTKTSNSYWLMFIFPIFSTQKLHSFIFNFSPSQLLGFLYVYVYIYIHMYIYIYVLGTGQDTDTFWCYLGAAELKHGPGLHCTRCWTELVQWSFPLIRCNLKHCLSWLILRVSTNLMVQAPRALHSFK